MQRCLESPYFIDRASVCRERSEWLAAQSAGGEVLVAAGSQLLTRTDGTGEPLWVTLKAVSEVLDEWLEPIFLGQVDGRSYFVVVVPSLSKPSRSRVRLTASLKHILQVWRWHKRGFGMCMHSQRSWGFGIGAINSAEVVEVRLGLKMVGTCAVARTRPVGNSFFPIWTPRSLY